MATVSCSQCGKHDSLLNMRTCICFEHSFCSEEHFNQHAHSKVVDEIHAQDVNIGPNIRRLFKKAKFDKALKSMKEEFIAWIGNGIFMFSETFKHFREQISASRRDEFELQLRVVLKAIQVEINKYPEDATEDEHKDQETNLTKASAELLRIWQSENRLSLTQTAKAIKNAWIMFLMTLVKYYYSPEEKTSNEIDILIPKVARVLGGGKDEFATQ